MEDELATSEHSSGIQMLQGGKKHGGWENYKEVRCLIDTDGF